MTGSTRKALVVGGAGYIGSHMVRTLLRSGWEVVVLDNLSTGHAQAAFGAKMIRGSVLNVETVSQVLRSERPDVVMHFAALSIVVDSVSRPLSYYRHNVGGTINLLQAMCESGVNRLVFSSTAAVYGAPQHAPIDESYAIAPLSPYGTSKHSAECVISDACRANGIRAAALRYFNAAGAEPDGSFGEAHEPETHLIPNVLRAVLGQRSRLMLFGDNHPTQDGYCVRDYVHVSDLCAAHLLAAGALDREDLPEFQIYNLGNGAGFSVMEVLRSAERVVGRPIPYEVSKRRAGDPPTLVACSDKANAVLGWRPVYRELDAIIDTAWRWHQNPRF